MLYICNVKIKCIFNRNDGDHFFREVVQGTGGGGGVFWACGSIFCSSESWVIQCDNTTRKQSWAVSFQDES